MYCSFAHRNCIRLSSEPDYCSSFNVFGLPDSFTTRIENPTVWKLAPFCHSINLKGVRYEARELIGALDVLHKAISILSLWTGSRRVHYRRRFGDFGNVTKWEKKTVI